MMTNSAPARRLSANFWKFWIGQSISNLGSSVTMFALIIGAWVDRVNRKQLMIATDIGRALMIASIPLLDALGMLSIWWIYAAGFINATLTIGFDSSEFAAIPNLVAQDDLVTANGRIQA